MGTDKVTYAVVELPEAALTGSHGSGRVRMRNQNLGFPPFFRVF